MGAEGADRGAGLIKKSLGATLIAIERNRQVSDEGWTPEHDAEHKGGVLALAAICYAAPTPLRNVQMFRQKYWPWHRSSWKPTPDDRIRELVKAGALVAAEIDRLIASRATQIGNDRMEGEVTA